MVLLPRLARALNKPAIATVLGLVLVVVAIIGMVTGDIRTGWAIIILVIGAINVLRAIPHPRCELGPLLWTRRGALHGSSWSEGSRKHALLTECRR
jgi:hypothetical protein